MEVATGAVNKAGPGPLSFYREDNQQNSKISLPSDHITCHILRQKLSLVVEDVGSHVRSDPLNIIEVTGRHKSHTILRL